MTSIAQQFRVDVAVFDLLACEKNHSLIKVYVALCHGDGWTYARLSQTLHLSQSTVMRCLRRLEALEIIPTPHRSNIDDDTRWRIYERDGYRCQKCGSRRSLTLDHIIARKNGGSGEESNLQTLCKSCNSRKGARI